MLKISDNVERKFVDSVVVTDWDIDTDRGWCPILAVHKTIEYAEYKITTIDGSIIECADTHILFDENMQEIFAKDVKPGYTYVMLRSGPSLVDSISENGKSSNMFDIEVDSSDHRYYTGNFLSHNTSLLSAICFGLFGRGYGAINKPALVNSINQKKLMVELEFSIGKKEYKIRRGMKPNVFEIYENNKLINQDPSIKDYQKVLEQHILKFNYRAFTQVVAVGGGADYTPFMRLSAKDRREFIEDLLDIRVFSIMNSIIKEDTKNIKDRLKEYDFMLKSIKDKVALQHSFVTKLKKDKKESSDKIIKSIELFKTQNITLKAKLEELKSKVAICDTKLQEHTKLDDALSDMRLANKQLQSRLNKSKEQSKNYENMSVCPTCSQSLPEKHKEDVISEYTKETNIILNEIIELEQKEKEVFALMGTYNEYINQYQLYSDAISDIQNELFANNKAIKYSNEQLEYNQNDNNSITTEEDKLKEISIEYVKTESKKKKTLETRQYQELIQQILSDSGIKSKIIKQYIPTINKLINKYLDDFELFLSMSLDDTFNETFKSRYRDSFTYENFSEGQKRRIDISILLTWIEIARAKNALHTNVAFFDEFDSMLDKEGSDLFLSALKNISCDNVFIISHKTDILMDKADNVIEFRLHNNFTEVVSD